MKSNNTITLKYHSFTVFRLGEYTPEIIMINGYTPRTLSSFLHNFIAAARKTNVDCFGFLSITFHMSGIQPSVHPKNRIFKSVRYRPVCH